MMHPPDVVRLQQDSLALLHREVPVHSVVRLNTAALFESILVLIETFAVLPIHPATEDRKSAAGK